MQRLTARLVLVLVMVSVNFAPLVGAISVPNAHACCLRRLHAAKDSPLQISDATAPHGNCCPPMTTRQSAQAADLKIFSAELVVASLDWRPARVEHSSEFTSRLSARAPPAFS